MGNNIVSGDSNCKSKMNLFQTKKDQLVNISGNNKPGVTKAATVTGSHKSSSKQLVAIKNSNISWQLASGNKQLVFTKSSSTNWC